MNGRILTIAVALGGLGCGPSSSRVDTYGSTTDGTRSDSTTDVSGPAPGAGLVYIVSGAALTGTSTLQAAALATLEGQYDRDQLGTDVHRLPDLDGDGTEELLVHAHGRHNDDVAHLFIVAGADLRAGTTRVSGTTPAILRGVRAGGVAVADLDADGLPELFVAGGNRVFGFAGTGLGLHDLDEVDAFWVLNGGDDAQISGPVSVGDLDGDGVADLLTSVPMHGLDEEREKATGAIDVWSGAGVLAGGSWTLDDATARAVGTLDDPASLAFALAAGDVNADDRADLWLRTRLVSGGSLAKGSIETLARIDHTEGSARIVHAGFDRDDDGVGDALAFAWWFDGGRAGEVAWFSGASLQGDQTFADASVSNRPDYRVPTQATPIEDVDDDGREDFLVARGLVPTPSDLVVLGSASPFDLDAPLATLVDGTTPDQLIVALTPLADLDGDGVAELAVGVPTARPHDVEAPRVGTVARPCGDDIPAHDDGPEASLSGWFGSTPTTGPEVVAAQFFDVSDPQDDTAAVRRFLDGDFLDEVGLPALELAVKGHYQVSWVVGSEFPRGGRAHVGFVIADEAGHVSRCFESVWSD